MIHWRRTDSIFLNSQSSGHIHTHKLIRVTCARGLFNVYLDLFRLLKQNRFNTTFFHSKSVRKTSGIMASLRLTALLRSVSRSPQNLFKYSHPTYRSITIDSSQYADRAGNLEHTKNFLPELPKNHELKTSEKLLLRECTLVVRNNVVLPIAKKNKQQGLEKDEDEKQDIQERKIPHLILADGMKGVGKSSLIAQTVTTARAQGYLVLYIPNAREWIDGEGFYVATSPEGRNPALEGISAIRWYDRPTQTLNLFRSFLEAHGEQLEKLKVQENFIVDATRECSSLRDVVETGIAVTEDVDSNWLQNPRKGGDILDHLMKELTHCEDPVAIVIDDYESLVGMTCMMSAKREKMHANSIRFLAQHLGRDAIEKTASTIKNGFVMLTTQQQPSFEEWRKSRVRSSLDFPLSEEILNDPSGRIWLSALKEQVSSENELDKLYVNVPNLTDNELKAVCATFGSRGLREDSRRDARPEMDRLVALSGGRGHNMKRIFESR